MLLLSQSQLYNSSGSLKLKALEEAKSKKQGSIGAKTIFHQSKMLGENKAEFAAPGQKRDEHPKVRVRFYFTTARALSRGFARRLQSSWKAELAWTATHT